MILDPQHFNADKFKQFKNGKVFSLLFSSGLITD